MPDGYPRGVQACWLAWGYLFPGLVDAGSVHVVPRPRRGGTPVRLTSESELLLVACEVDEQIDGRQVERAGTGGREKRRRSAGGEERCERGLQGGDSGGQGGRAAERVGDHPDAAAQHSGARFRPGGFRLGLGECGLGVRELVR